MQRTEVRQAHRALYYFAHDLIHPCKPMLTWLSFAATFLECLDASMAWEPAIAGEIRRIGSQLETWGNKVFRSLQTSGDTAAEKMYTLLQQLTARAHEIETEGVSPYLCIPEPQIRSSREMKEPSRFRMSSSFLGKIKLPARSLPENPYLGSGMMREGTKIL